MGLAEAWGVAPGYHDIGGRWVAAEPGAVSRALEAMGADGPEPPAARTLVVAAGETPRLRGPAEVVTEDGAVLPAGDGLPEGLPPGYHTLHLLDGGSTSRLIVSPRRCHLPPERQAWGWAAQLYAVRS